MRAVIFDIDGTLLDSVDLHARAWVEAFRHFGIETDAQHVRRQIGKGGDELMPVFLSQEQLEREGEAIEAYRSDLFKREYRHRVRPFPNVRGLFERIREAGLRTALASSGKREDVEHYQGVLKIADLVDVVTSSDDVERSKPHPDIFQAALKQLHPLDPTAILAVGDTPYDAEAAGRAGIGTIGLLCGGFPEAELSAAGCVAIYRDPQDLLDGIDASPLVRR